jgi:hypothetical protein
MRARVSSVGTSTPPGGWIRRAPPPPPALAPVTSLVMTCIQNVEFQKLELKWSARKSNKIVFLFLSLKFLDLILASTMLLGLITC